MDTINAKYLLALSACMSAEETRPYLQGVYVDAAHTLVATDGHVMGVIRPDLGTYSPSFFESLAGKIIALPPAKELKAKRGFDAWVTYESGKMRVTLGRNLEEATAVTAPTTYMHPKAVFVDGSFPDWRRIVPRGTGRHALGDKLGISTVLFDSIAHFFGGGIKTGQSVQIFAPPPGYKGGDALVLRSNQADRFMVLMPRRAGEISTPLPDWFK